MELFTKCNRCGALMQTRCVDGGFTRKIHLAPCVMTGEVSSDGATAGDEIEHTVLCPGCMEGLKAWLAEEPEGPQETDGIADNDSVGKLAADMAKIAIRTMASGEDGADTAACHYFGHSGVPCVDASGVPCRAYNIIGKTCAQFALDDVRRRCEELGIDLTGDGDE